MLSLELWTKNSQGERTYQGTYRRTWKTMRGLENFRQKVMDYNGYTLEDFKIKGEESRKDTPRRWEPSKWETCSTPSTATATT